MKTLVTALSLLVLSAFSANAQLEFPLAGEDEPVCFISSGAGATLDLTQLCGYVAPATTPTTVVAAPVSTPISVPQPSIT